MYYSQARSYAIWLCISTILFLYINYIHSLKLQAHNFFIYPISLKYLLDFMQLNLWLVEVGSQHALLYVLYFDHVSHTHTETHKNICMYSEVWKCVQVLNMFLDEGWTLLYVYSRGPRLVFIYWWIKFILWALHIRMG